MFEELLIPQPVFRFYSGPPTAAQKKGMAYEQRVSARLREMTLGAKHWDHPWIVGPMQPDFVFQFPSCLLLIEIKLTYTDCFLQFEKYKKQISTVVSAPIFCCQICKNLTVNSPEPEDFFSISSSPAVVQWWI